jgi:hypothetical protein
MRKGKFGIDAMPGEDEPVPMVDARRPDTLMEPDLNWDDSDRTAAKVGRLLGEIIHGLCYIAASESWPADKLLRLHKNIVRDERQLQPDERLFSTDGVWKVLNPATVEGWGHLLGFGKERSAVHKYVGKTFRRTHKVQYRHLRRLLIVLTRLQVLSSSPEYTKAQTTWRPFLIYVLEEIRRRQRNPSAERHDAEEQNSPIADDFNEATETPTSRTSIDDLILDDPRTEGRHLRTLPLFAHSVMAKIQFDEFQERQADLDFLARFLGQQAEGKTTVPQFRWALITGAAGQGKTRLAIHFLGRAEARGFAAGFMSWTEAKRLNARRWRPRRPTFIVIDYAAESPAVVAKILAAFASTALTSGFSVPVRVLLLEREASGNWLRTAVPEDSIGANVRSLCYVENDNGMDHPLSPLSSSALINIMRGRLSGTQFSDQFLIDAITRIDPQRRPIFAAGVAQAITNATEGGADPIGLIAKLQPTDVLRMLINRARVHFWSKKETYDTRSEQRQLALHENLLAVATIALDVSCKQFEDECPVVSRKYLPELQAFDEDRYGRMAGGDPTRVLKRLEPDLLGELFVFDLLNKKPSNEGQAIIDAGLWFGGMRSAAFLARCAVDFPDAWRSQGYLRPSIPGLPMTTFVATATYLAHKLPQDRLGDITNLISITEDLANSDPEVRKAVPAILMAKVFRLLRLDKEGRDEQVIAILDQVISQYSGMVVTPNYAARALYLKAEAFRQLGRGDDAIALYDEFVKDFANATEPDLRLCVAYSIIGKNEILKKSTAEVAVTPREMINSHEAGRNEMTDVAVAGLMIVYDVAINGLVNEMDLNLKRIYASAFFGKLLLLCQFIPALQSTVGRRISALAAGLHSADALRRNEEQASVVLADVFGALRIADDAQLRPFVHMAREFHGTWTRSWPFAL